MMPIVLTLSFALLVPGNPAAGTESPRRPHPLAPSLPELSDEEEERIDRVIDRFIQYDIGKLRGEEGKQALKDFQQLGPEAIPALIRGLNRAATIEASCPAVIIAKKLAGMLNASDDADLLEFARENIGAGVTRSRHMVVLKDLRTACMLRKNLVARKPTAPRASPGEKSLQAMSVSALAEAAGSERGPRLKQILTELEQRRGDQVVATLGSAAAAISDTDTKQLARDSLVRNLSRQSTAYLKEKLKDDRSEVRSAAARVIGNKRLPCGKELIDVLEDTDADVLQAARQALVRLSRGADFGPERGANEADRAAALRKWRDWWAAQK